MSFDYRAALPRMSAAAIIGVAIVGVLLTIGCGIWLFGPVIASSGYRTTTGTIVSWQQSAAITATSAISSTPVISFRVGRSDYRFHSPLETQAPDVRALPAGAAVTVRYNPLNPTNAQWVPTGSTLAVNTWGGVGLCTGILLLAVAAIFTVIAARQRKRGIS